MKAVMANPARAVRRMATALVALPRRVADWSRRKPRTSGVLAGALLVVFLAGTASFTVLHVRAQDVADARESAIARAQKAVPELLSYDHKTLADDLSAKSALLTGSFKADYTKLLRNDVLPAAEKSGLVTTSTSVGAGVEADDGPDRITVLMFVNQSTGSEGQAPNQMGSRVRVTMERSEGHWLIASLKPV